MQDSISVLDYIYIIKDLELELETRNLEIPGDRSMWDFIQASVAHSLCLECSADVHITQYGSIEPNLFTSIYVYTRTSSSRYMQTHLLGLQDVNVSFSVVPKSFYTSLATILLFMIPGQKFVRAVSTP